MSRAFLPERNDMDIIKVIEAIKVSPTHSNIMLPGQGREGYCLPKDGGFGIWAYQTLWGFEGDIFKITSRAIDINDTRALQVFRLVRDALRNMGKIVLACKIAIFGASYIEKMSGTHATGARKCLFESMPKWGRKFCAHDPYVMHWCGI
ncbi:MAG: hypothetical protein ACLQBD_12135 [Syntrophobacteraceae bacterium]